MEKISWAEPYKIKMVEPLFMTTTRTTRASHRKPATTPSCCAREDVYIDLLTDSGVPAMSDRQWAGMMLGDEAYAGSATSTTSKRPCSEYYGYKHMIPTHQGRGAEHILIHAC
jgi:tyrosine phenol-lyase